MAVDCLVLVWTAVQGGVLMSHHALGAEVQPEKRNGWQRLGMETRRNLTAKVWRPSYLRNNLTFEWEISYSKRHLFLFSFSGWMVIIKSLSCFGLLFRRLWVVAGWRLYSQGTFYSIFVTVKWNWNNRCFFAVNVALTCRDFYGDNL